jgi:methionyl-tRNA formyltransferase
MTPVAPLRVAFFGLPLAALLLARDGHDVVLASVCRADGLGLRRLRRVLGDDRVLVVPDANDGALLRRLQEARIDLLVSWFWTKRLPMTLVGTARLGGIGVHPSLLPRHRGPDPTFWAIASGDTETGVTVHRLEAEYDTGAILVAERLTIDPAWNAWQLARALDRPSLRQLRSVVRRFANGDPPPDTAQDAALATAAPTPADEDTAIRWAWSTERIVLHVRALAPAPGAWTEIGDPGTQVILTRVAPAPTFPASLAPGEGAAIGGVAVVRTGDGAVVLLEGEVEGATVSAADLAALFPRAP